MTRRVHGRNRNVCACIGACVLLTSGPLHARDIFAWNNVGGGNFDTAANWSLVSGAGPPPPGIGDTARFNLAASYNTAFLTTASCDTVEVTAGTVDWAGPNFSVGNLFITSGAADLLVSGGSTLRIGEDSNSSWINLLVGDDLIVAGGGLIIIRLLSTVDCDDLLIGTLGSGTVRVIDDSSLDAIGLNDNSISNGTLQFEDDATGTLEGTTLVGVTPVAGSSGLIRLQQPGNSLETDSLVVGGGASPTAMGEIDVQNGSLTMLNGSTLTVGGPAGSGPGQVLAGQFGNGTLSTFGQTFVNPTGLLLGDIEFGDDVTVDGGVLLPDATDFAAGSTVNLLNDGLLSLGEEGGTIADVVVTDGVSMNLSTGADLQANDVNIGAAAGMDGTITLDGAGTTGVQLPSTPVEEAELNVGNATGTASLLQVANGASWDTGFDPVIVGASGTIEAITGGAFNLLGDLLVDGGAVNLVGGVVAIDQGLDVTAQNGGQVMLPASFDATVDAGELWQVLSGSSFSMPGTMALVAGGTFRIDAGSATLGSLIIDGGTLDFPSGSLTLNSDFTLDGDLWLDAGVTLTVNGATTVFGPDTLTIGGGGFATNALNLDTWSTLDFLSGTMTVTGPVTALGGSLLNLRNANVMMGDPNEVDGFYCNGDLRTYDNTITIQDANTAMFDSAAHVMIGEAGNPGTIVAANGLTLDFGANLVGDGVVNSPDNAATPLINNGHIGAADTGGGGSPEIELTGYVKGVGTFDGVLFSGTYSPGFSPAAVNLGTVEYLGTLTMEIGGLLPGSGHDQLNHVLGAGEAFLGGTLEVELINGYNPSAGSEFTIITATCVDATFDDVILPPGLAIEYQPDRVIIRDVCVADVANNDGVVDVLDLLAVLGAWGGCDTFQCPDTNGDSMIDVLDLLIVLGAWGPCN